MFLFKGKNKILKVLTKAFKLSLIVLSFRYNSNDKMWYFNCGKYIIIKKSYLSNDIS